MRRLGLLALALVLLSGVPACRSNVHRAKILDVRLGVQVRHLRPQPLKLQPTTRHPLTMLKVVLSISNPSDQRVWVNDCHGQALDDGGDVAYTFSFTPGSQAGQLLQAHQTWTGWVLASARVPHEVAATAVRATATCQAWDWGEYPPI